MLLAFLSALAYTSCQSTFSEMLLSAECKDRGISGDECLHSEQAHSTAAKRFAAASAIMNAASFLTTNLIGQIAQKIGRKPALILPIMGMASSFILLSLFRHETKHFNILLGGLAACSLGGSIFSILAALFTIAADTAPVPRDDRDGGNANAPGGGEREEMLVRANMRPDTYAAARQVIAEKTLTSAFGLIEGVVWLGFVAGPSLGHFIAARYSFRATFFFAGALEAIVGIGALCGLAETIGHARGAIQWRLTTPFSGIVLLNRSSYSRKIAAIVMLSLVGSLGAISIVPLYIKKTFGMSTQEVGYIQTIIFLSGAIGLLWVLPILRNKGYSGKSIILIGLITTAIALGSFTFLAKGWEVYIASLGLAFSAVLFPVARALLSRALGAETRPTMLAAYGSLEVLAAVVSPLMFPNLYSLVQPVKFGLFDLLTLGPGVVFLIATGVLLVACVIAGTLPKTAPEVAEVPDTQWHTTPTATDAAAAAVVNNNGY